MGNSDRGTTYGNPKRLPVASLCDLLLASRRDSLLDGSFEPLLSKEGITSRFQGL